MMVDIFSSTAKKYETIDIRKNIPFSNNMSQGVDIFFNEICCFTFIKFMHILKASHLFVINIRYNNILFIAM